jgi:hypothetical protein
MSITDNHTPLSRPLLVKAALGSTTLITLGEAAAYIQQHCDKKEPHWQSAAGALDAAQKDQTTIEQATLSFEKALRTDDLLA